MATANNKRIEETATTALKSALLRCPILESYIDSNDKTPSWDGTVFVYRNEKQKKADLIGRVPIQVKGTEKEIISDKASFSCSVTDLRNYYNDGGCVFFLVSVIPQTGESRIFFASLLVFDLKKILDNAGEQKTFTIKLNSFPADNINEIATIFISFVENSRKQMSFIGKEIFSLDQLAEKGIDVESVSFNTSGLGLNQFNIGNFITTHDIYLYAKPKGIDIEIPVDKVSNAIVSRPIMGKVMVKNTEHYPSYCVVYEKGNSTFRIGKGISIVLSKSTGKLSLSFKPVGTLSDFIKDAACFIDVVENKEITLNGARLSFHGMVNVDLDNYKQSLLYYKDAQRMLDLLGVTEELQCENLSDNDEKNIRNFVNAMLYNKKIGFPGADGSSIYGAFKIANLSIWIWASKQDDGYYQLDNFFNLHQMAIFEDTDVTQSNPVPVSQFLLLNKDAFVHTSNMDYEIVGNDICAMKHHPLLLDEVTSLLLNTLSGYDEQTNKDSRLLDLADKICGWLSGYGEEVDPRILKLNQLQIIKRKRELIIPEIVELGKLVDAINPEDIRCGAYLLLGDVNEAQKCFEEMPPDSQDEFITYPICHFGKLKKAEDKSNG